MIDLVTGYYGIHPRRAAHVRERLAEGHVRKQTFQAEARANVEPLATLDTNAARC
jgi:hypothetical protein